MTMTIAETQCRVEGGLRGWSSVRPRHLREMEYSDRTNLLSSLNKGFWYLVFSLNDVFYFLLLIPSICSFLCLVLSWFHFQTRLADNFFCFHLASCLKQWRWYLSSSFVEVYRWRFSSAPNCSKVMDAWKKIYFESVQFIIRNLLHYLHYSNLRSVKEARHGSYCSFYWSTISILHSF